MSTSFLWLRSHELISNLLTYLYIHDLMYTKISFLLASIYRIIILFELLHAILS